MNNQTIFETTNRNNYKITQVTQADGVYAVLFLGKPITIRTFNSLLNYEDQTFVYIRTTFPNPAHAKNLARKLNKEHKTDGFEVKELIEGKTVKL